jgi:hypothetical protein
MIIDSNVQMVLIICLTIIACYIINCLKSDSKGERENRDNERFGYCKSPTYQRPPRPGSGIGHNPSPIGEKPGFPSRGINDTSELDKNFKRS